MSTISSGTSAKATVDDDAVSLIAVTPGRTFKHVAIFNQGPNPGFWKIGAGGNLNRIPADFFLVPDNIQIQEDEEVFIQRVAGGAEGDMTEVFGFKW